MYDRHGRLNIFQRKMILIRMAFLGLRSIERALEVSQQLFQPDDAILFAHIPLF